MLGVATGIGSMHRCAAVLATPRVRGARQVSQPRRLEAYGTSIRTPSTGGWQSQESDAQRRKRQQLRTKILILSRCRDRPPNRSSPVLTGPVYWWTSCERQGSASSKFYRRPILGLTEIPVTGRSCEKALSAVNSGIPWLGRSRAGASQSALVGLSINQKKNFRAALGRNRLRNSDQMCGRTVNP